MEGWISVNDALGRRVAGTVQGSQGSVGDTTLAPTRRYYLDILDSDNVLEERRALSVTQPTDALERW